MPHKKIALISLFSFLAFGCWAQDEKTSWITLSANLNSVWIVNQNNFGNPMLEYSTKFGTSAEIGFARIVAEKMGYNFAIGYGKFGQDYSGDLVGAQATRKLTINYVKVPLMFMIKTRKFPSPAWIEVGPQVMVATGAVQYFTRDSGGDPLPNPQYLPKGDTVVNDWISPVDMMLNFKYYSMHKLDRNDRLFFKAGFETAFGFLDINTKEYRIPSYRTKEYKASHNYYIGLQLGLMFKPKKN